LYVRILAPMYSETLLIEPSMKPKNDPNNEVALLVKLQSTSELYLEPDHPSAKCTGAITHD